MKSSPFNQIYTSVFDEFFKSESAPYIEEIPEEYRLHLGIYDFQTLAMIEEAYKTFDSPGFKCSKTLRSTLNHKGYIMRGNDRESSIIFIDSRGEGEIVILSDDYNDDKPCISQQDAAALFVNLLKTYVHMFPINYDTIFPYSTKIKRIQATIKHFQNEQLTSDEEEFIGQPLDPFAQTSFKEFMSKFAGVGGYIRPNAQMTRKIVDFLNETRK